MAEKSNVKPSTMWSSKPVKMKLFGAWEIDKTPPDCIPRLCSLNINRLSWTPSMRQDVTAIIVAVKMQNSKRILRSNEIAIALPSHTSDSPASADIELDLSFTLQYPHFLKRNCNYLQIILQRRKKYKNKAILGFKTLACGVIDMAEVLQRSTIVEKDIDLIGHVKESGKNENLARITISTLRSQPIDQDSNLRRGKVSIDRPDVYSDEDDFTSAEDGSDSETIEEGNARDRMNHFRRKVNSRKPRKLFSGNDKFQSGVPSNVQQRNLKQKFISLLKKFRLPDSEGVYDSEEKFQEALEKELMSSNQEPADIDEYFDDDDIDELDYMSDSGQEFDDVSISSTPKPSLRPFFSSCTLVGQDKPEEQFPAFQGKKPFDNDSQENSGAEQTPDTSDTSQKHTEPQEPVSLKKSEETKKKAANDKEVKRVKLFPTAKDKENKSQPKERKQPVSNSLSLTSASMSKDDSSPKEFILEQLNKVFSSDEHNIPDEILFINMAECAQAALLMAVFERTHHIIGTNTLSDVKFSFTFLCNKIQKFCNSNLKTPIPIKLALIGSEAYVNSFLRIYVDLLSSKSPDWQTYLRFYLIPASFINSSSPASSSPLHKYLASIDPAYAGYFHTSKDSVESSRDAGGSSEAAAASSAGAVAGGSGAAGGSLVSVQELYSKVVNYLNGAQTLLQIPIAEAMVTYKDKTGEDEPSQVFIPFISDAKIGLLDSIYGNHSMDNDDATFVVGGTPSQTTGAANAATSEKSVTSPLSTKDQHASMSLTPPNSPSISSNQTFLSQTGSGGKADKEREHKEKEKEKDKEKEKEKDKEKDALASEAIDLQIDYWTVQQKLNDLSNKEAKKSDNCKFTLKNCFRNLQISRLPMLGEQSISSLTLFYVLKEKKKQIMRLGKKKEKENESKCQVVEGICRLVCSYKATQSPIKVNIDGVELTGVKFFQLTTQWQTQIKFFPLVIFSTPDSFAVNSSPFGNSSNNYKMLKLLHSYLLLINLINKMAKLSDDEIINFMKDMLSYTVKREQLSSPNRQLVIEVYAQFLQELDFDVNSITQRDFMACGDMTNVEAMDGILVPIHIYTIVQQCVVHYGIHDMNLMDILSPKRSRTNRIISALCFFFLRYSAVKKEWLRLKNEGLAIRTEILQLKQKDQELKHLIEEKSMLFTSLNNNSEAMEKEKNALIEENKKKKRESDEKSEQFKLTKTEILKLEDRLCSVNIEISKGKEEIKQLEELIIKSPQKSIQITADMERALMELKKEVPEKKQQLMTINKMIDCYKAVLTYLKPSTGDISNLLIMLSSTDKECENLENIKQDTLSLREEIKSIKIKMSECQKAKQGWQTKINNWARQHQRIFGQLEGLNNGLQESKKKKSEDIAKLQGQKQWVEKALKQLQNTNDNLDKDFQEIEKRYTDTIFKYKEELVKRF